MKNNFVNNLAKKTVVMAVLLCSLSGCTQEKKPEGIELKPVVTHLYEYTFTTDYDWSYSSATAVSGFGCTAVQNGRYRGRNYDWTYADTDLCILHTTVTENRPHASVAVADLGFMKNADGSYNYNMLPFVSVDGINDAGVCIQVNVMPFGENGKLNHTAETEDDMAGGAVVRYVLDYADSVTDAVEMLKGRDIQSEMQEAEELHWMISGPTSTKDSTIKTVVLEVFPDGLHVTENFVDDKPIMANFNVSNFDGSAQSTGVGFGYERWEIVKENFDSASSVIGTFDLMEKIFFSKMYDLWGERFWYSEYNGTDLGKYYSAEELKSLMGEEKYSYYMDNYGAVIYNADLYDGEFAIHGDIARTGIISKVVESATGKYIAQDMTDGSLWITIHTSVYDLQEKTLDIQLRESHDHYHFTID